MYQHGKRTKQKTGGKTFLQASFVIGLLFVIVALVLKSDLANNQKEKTAVPIITEVSGAKTDVADISEPLFSMKLPRDWSQSNRVQSNSANFYEWRSNKQGGNDRMLQLHIDTMPPSYKIVRMLPLTPHGNRLNVGNISGNCIEFARDAGIEQRTQGNAPSLAKWENVTFMCDPINNNQTIGTGAVGDTIGTVLKGNSGEHKFFFYYEDHNIRPDDQIFINAVKSFEAK